MAVAVLAVFFHRCRAAIHHYDAYHDHQDDDGNQYSTRNRHRFENVSHELPHQLDSKEENITDLRQ